MSAARFPTTTRSSRRFGDVGWTYLHGTRSISNCTDCRTDELDLQSGGFWRAGLELTLHARRAAGRVPVSYGLHVACQGYDANAGLDHEIQVGFTAWML